MRNFNREQCSRPAEKFKALGHPIRLWIAQQLLIQEHCVQEFVEPSGLDVSTVSQHLAVLKQAGVLTDEKRGKYVFYRLRCPCVRKFLECIDEHRRTHGCNGQHEVESEAEVGNDK